MVKSSIYISQKFFKCHVSHSGMDDLVSSGCPLSRKIWWTVQIGSFCPNFFGEFVGQDGLKEGLHENEFWLFSNTKMEVANS